MRGGRGRREDRKGKRKKCEGKRDREGMERGVVRHEIEERKKEYDLLEGKWRKELKKTRVRASERAPEARRERRRKKRVTWIAKESLAERNRGREAASRERDEGVSKGNERTNRARVGCLDPGYVVPCFQSLIQPPAVSLTSSPLLLVVCA